MESLTLFSSASGRIGPRPFARGVIVVYAASFLSQVLISPPVTGRWGVWMFALAQALLTWAWFALHAGRLRDAGLSIGPATAIAVLYALALVLLVLLIGPLVGTDAGGPEAPSTSFSDLWVILLLLAAFTGQGSVDFFYFLALGMLALILIPVGIALGFSIWTATRPAIPAVP
jgi:hypothetical protein